MIVGKFVAVVIIAYLLGAIPFGLIVSKLIAKIDISKHGSGSIGSTNVMRTLGIKAGALVGALDLAKAIGAVILAKTIIGDSVLLVAGFPFHWQVAQVIAALMVMAGHNWSVFIKFRGGKGVAVYFGSWLIIWPVGALFGGLIMLLIVLRTRYMSMGSISGALGILCLSIFLTIAYDFPPIYLIYSVVAAALIVYQHRENISRLQTGTESPIYGKGTNLKL